jgi:hypothetical protein
MPGRKSSEPAQLEDLSERIFAFARPLIELNEAADDERELSRCLEIAARAWSNDVLREYFGQPSSPGDAEMIAYELEHAGRPSPEMIAMLMERRRKLFSPDRRFIRNQQVKRDPDTGRLCLHLESCDVGEELEWLANAWHEACELRKKRNRRRRK